MNVVGEFGPIDGSLDAPALVALADEWAKVRGRAGGGDASAVAEVKSLAKRIVAHRARLFEANAALEAGAPSDDDPASSEQIARNGRAIKVCTTLLSEMSAVLGRASVPSTGD